MPANVFLSFERHNLIQVDSIRALAKNPQHALEFHDYSELEPVRDKRGTPLPYPPDDPRSKPIKKELRRLLKKAAKMVVVVGDYTHESDWVNWEIQSFYDRYNSLNGDGDKRILAIAVNKARNPQLPKILTTYSIPRIGWDLDMLTRWLKENPNLVSTSFQHLYT